MKLLNNTLWSEASEKSGAFFLLIFSFFIDILFSLRYGIFVESKRGSL